MGLWNRGVQQRHEEALHFLKTGQFTGSMAPSQGGPGIQSNAADDQNRITENSSGTIGATGGGTVASNLTSSSECVDSSDCASGWRCSGGKCRPPRNSAGGGHIANNDQGCGGSPTFDVAGLGGGSSGGGGGGGNCGAGTGTGSSGSDASFGAFGRQDAGGCTKSGCGGDEGNGVTLKSASGSGGGGGGGGGSPNGCCGQSRCCRVSAYGTQCFCGNCPPPPPTCNRFCGALFQSQGETSAGCPPGSTCDECSTCTIYGNCVPISGGNCRCGGSGCGDCQSCTESGECKSSSSNCGPPPSPPPGNDPGGNDPDPCAPKCSTIEVSGTTCPPGRSKVGTITVGTETVSLCQKCSPPPDCDPPAPPPGGCGDCQIEDGEGGCKPDPACSFGWVVSIAYWRWEEDQFFDKSSCSPNGPANPQGTTFSDGHTLSTRSPTMIRQLKKSTNGESAP